MKAKTIILLIGFFALMLLTCRKEKEDPAGGNKIEIGDNVIDSVSYFFTKVETGVVSLGGNEIIQHGHCWDTQAEPAIDGNRTFLGHLTSANNFQSVIDSLEPNTIYYIRPYIQTAYVVVYGKEEQIKTLKTGKPVVSTNPVSEITLTTALCGGIVTYDSGLVVTARGVCWDTTEIFRIDSCLGFTVDSLGLGSFSSEITGLHEGTNYHLAAYATNEKGTGYGEIITFATVPITPPVVVTSDITNITTTSAQSGGNVTSEGNGTVTLRGVCWDTLSTPTFENNLGHTEDGNGTGEFTSNITNLDDGKTYFVIAYATNEKGTGYGEITSFTATPIITPQVTTADVTSVTATSAQCGGNVTNNGNGSVTSRGVCWNNSGNPTLTNNLGHTEDGSGLGTFMSNITGLEGGGTYYVAAYATNENETGYGEILSFTTLILPTVNTTAISNIDYNTATSGGNVINDGGTPVSSRGVCWNISPNPTIFNLHTIDGYGIGSFVSNITGLTHNTTYNLRAYATSIAGTTYGANIIFTTLSHCPGTETVAYEGQIYNTLQIGNQCWLKENLNVGIVLTGNQNPNNNGVIEKFCYGDNTSNCTIYGGLYSWDEMMQYTTQQGIQGICPAGWHIPTNAEFTILADFLGGYNIAGGKMKETGTVHWFPPNFSATNESGFTALPGGMRYTNLSNDLGTQAHFWSSSEFETDIAMSRLLDYYYAGLFEINFDKAYRLSVRCVKDE